MVVLMSNLSALFAFIFLSIAISTISAQLLLGGWTEQTDLENPEYQQVAQFAVASLNMFVGDASDPWTLTTIISMETQVVAGMNYRIRALLTQAVSETNAVYEFVVYKDPQQDLSLTTYTLMQV